MFRTLQNWLDDPAARSSMLLPKLTNKNWQLFMSNVNMADGRNDALSRPLMQCIKSSASKTHFSCWEPESCHSLLFIKIQKSQPIILHKKQISTLQLDEASVTTWVQGSSSAELIQSSPSPLPQWHYCNALNQNICFFCIYNTL